MPHSPNQDFSIATALGSGIGTPEASQDALDERLPREATGVIRTQPGSPAELLLLTDPDEAHWLTKAMRTYSDISGITYEATPVVRDDTEFLVTETGVHWAITTFKRPGSTEETPSPEDLKEA